MKPRAALAALSVTLAACQDAVTTTSPSEPLTPLTTVTAARAAPIAEWIEELQYTARPAHPSYGAVRIHHTPGYGEYYRVRPYDSNLGVIGLLRSSSPGKLGAAERWMTWYVTHMEGSSSPSGVVLDHWYRLDGSGETTCVGAGELCHFVDAADSGAATFLQLVWEYYKAGGNRKFLTSRNTREGIRTTAGVVLKLQQSDGLTVAKSDWAVKYLMDNSEVYLGLIAMARIETEVFGSPGNAAIYRSAAEACRAAILSELRNGAIDLFRIAKHPGGAQDPHAGRWYPDAAAQAWPILFEVVSPDSREAKIVMDTLNNRWNGRTEPDWTTDFVGGETVPWTDVAFAAHMTGDRGRAAAHTDFIIRKFGLDGSSAESFMWPFSVRHAGWVLRTLAAL